MPPAGAQRQVGKRVTGGKSTACSTNRLDLREDVAGLDLAHTRLVLAAIAHGAGLGEPGTTIQTVDGVPTIVHYDALATWPNE